MAKTAQQAFDFLSEHIIKNGGKYSDWYAGIASDPKARLFTDHNVSEENGKWAFTQCTNDQEARITEEALQKLGCKGDSGGGDKTTTFVYVYLITSSTKE